MTYETEALFGSAHAALVFAFNFSGQQFDKSAMARLASTPGKTGKGLGGLDGSGQSGMIRQELEAIGKLGEALMVARTAPRANPCSCRSGCCSGWKANKEWTNAIAFLADHMRKTALAGTTANGIMRFSCVIRYYDKKGERRTLEQIAKELDANRKSVGAYVSKVAASLKELEHHAMCAIEDRLREAGMVGEQTV